MRHLCSCSCKRGTYTQLFLSATHMNATPLSLFSQAGHMSVNFPQSISSITRGSPYEVRCECVYACVCVCVCVCVWYACVSAPFPALHEVPPTRCSVTVYVCMFAFVCVCVPFPASHGGPPTRYGVTVHVCV